MKDLTQGSVVRHLLQLSAFLAVSMLLQTLYFLVDLYFVSTLGGSAIAGVGLAGNLMMVMMALTQMLGIGTTSLMAQAAGRRDRDAAQDVFDQSCLLSLVVGGLVLIGGMVLREPYCRWLSAGEATVVAASQYMLWLVPSFALQFALISMGSALRATGVVKPGMIVQALTVGLNAVLAPVLIQGWGTGHAMGTAGAGLATFIAVAVGVVALGIYFVTNSTFVQLEPAKWRVKLDVWKRLLGIGLPSGGEFIMLAVYTMLVYWILRGQGADTQAGFSLGMRLMQALFLPVVAVSFGASPLAGQNFGARRFDRVRETYRAASLLAAAIMLVMTVVSHLSPEALVRVFTHSPKVVASGSEYLRIISWGYLFYGLSYTNSSMFQAVGNTWPSLLSSVARVALFAVAGLALSRSPGFEVRHLWYTAVIAGILQCGLSLLLLRREFARRLA